MNIKRNIIFSLECRKKNGSLIDKNVPIRMRVNYNGKRIDFNTGFRIDTLNWDKGSQRVKNGSMNKIRQHASDINTGLYHYYTVTQNIFKKYEISGSFPTITELKTEFNKKCRNEVRNYHNISGKVTLINLLDYFISECSKQNNWTNATRNKFLIFKNHLMNFDRKMTFETLDEKKLIQFMDYLKEKIKMRNTTIKKQLSFLRWYLRWAKKKGYTMNLSYESFRPKLKTTQKKVIFLTWEELNKLKKYPIHPVKQYLEKVRDIFLFCCFTGLRYSDVYNLRRSDIKENHIEVTTIKTSDSLIIELNKHSKAILEKYKNNPYRNGKALPVLSNQKMNTYLKELGELAEINESVREIYYMGNERIERVVPKYKVLSTHAGRRTFICNALALGIPSHVVMKWTGHNDFKAMKAYIDIADSFKANAMNKFNQI